jgi:hypothetical protein
VILKDKFYVVFFHTIKNCLEIFKQSFWKPTKQDEVWLLFPMPRTVGPDLCGTRHPTTSPVWLYCCDQPAAATKGVGVMLICFFHKSAEFIKLTNEIQCILQSDLVKWHFFSLSKEFLKNITLGLFLKAYNCIIPLSQLLNWFLVWNNDAYIILLGLWLLCSLGRIQSSCF